MEPITTFLFEQPWLQAVIGGAAMLIVLAGFWWALREGRSSRGWAIATVAVALLIGAGQFAQWAVVTDREQIRTQLDRVAAALEQGDVKSILDVTDEALIAQGRTRQQFERYLDGTLSSMKIRTPNIHRLEIVFPSATVAYVTVSGMATIESSGYSGIVSGSWKMEFNRTGGVWKIVTVEPVEGDRIVG